jgi:NAD(P)-dependent dehydrogenase (short-subunit alcohol dehydrogenase family)
MLEDAGYAECAACRSNTVRCSLAENSTAVSSGPANSGSPNTTAIGGRPGTGQLRPGGIASAAPMMATGTHGTPMVIDSTAGYMAMGSYSAVKAWVTSYTEGLAVELRGTGVRVTALCPGWVHTEFHERAGITTSSIPNALWIDAGLTIESGLKASEKGRVIVIPSARFKFLFFFVRHLPRGVVRWISGAISSSRRDSVETHA